MLSFLVPTLFPDLVKNLIQSIAADGLTDYEIVLCSPERIEGERVVWTEDKYRIGCDPAIRQCFLASRGDTIAVLPDDHLLLPGKLAAALNLLRDHELVDLNMGWLPKIFGLQSVCYPLCRRSVVDKCWPNFFPYIQHFGDHSFALAARRAGCPMLQCPEVCLAYPWQARSMFPESPTKTDPFAYRYGKARIFQDFPEYSSGWENREDFNQ